MFDWQDILDFWFGELDDDGIPDEDHRNRWFRFDRRTDQEIRRRFLSLTLLASEDGLTPWRAKPGGRLAEIILLDQFTRNIYRGGAMAFSNDEQARILCLEGLDKGSDVHLPGILRAFFYLPLTHSERLADQTRSVALFEQLHSQAEGLLKEFLGSFLQSAQDHRSVIERFGRFPHRNKALGRNPRSEELEYLAGGGRSYGQKS